MKPTNSGSFQRLPDRLPNAEESPMERVLRTNLMHTGSDGEQATNLLEGYIDPTSQDAQNLTLAIDKGQELREEEYYQARADVEVLQFLTPMYQWGLQVLQKNKTLIEFKTFVRALMSHEDVLSPNWAQTIIMDILKHHFQFTFRRGLFPKEVQKDDTRRMQILMDFGLAGPFTIMRHSSTDLLTEVITTTRDYNHFMVKMVALRVPMRFRRGFCNTNNESPCAAAIYSYYNSPHSLQILFDLGFTLVCFKTGPKNIQENFYDIEEELCNRAYTWAAEMTRLQNWDGFRVRGRIGLLPVLWHHSKKKYNLRANLEPISILACRGLFYERVEPRLKELEPLFEHIEERRFRLDMKHFLQLQEEYPDVVVADYPQFAISVKWACSNPDTRPPYEQLDFNHEAPDLADELDDELDELDDELDELDDVHELDELEATPQLRVSTRRTVQPSGATHRVAPADDENDDLLNATVQPRVAMGQANSARCMPGGPPCRILGGKRKTRRKITLLKNKKNNKNVITVHASFYSSRKANKQKKKEKGKGKGKGKPTKKKVI